MSEASTSMAAAANNIINTNQVRIFDLQKFCFFLKHDWCIG